MEVLPRCGHCVHEDVPDKVSNVISTIHIRLGELIETAIFLSDVSQGCLIFIGRKTP